ncbi:conserved hypothetical protein [Paecilomyces variotii No. 5]|uniref:Fe2OG dioxygenase domain-containing protein n=1 Tax=Byssochlamys spectabilis (strain No. 5 / NBRC 109023) TaxID=1356009 RepID=V5FW73_BYSSN|nr:conserved hypothetical protein [Paecilomyces variotii No. 5]
MKEIGLDAAGISPNAISEPFPLFTEEAIKQIRAEIFSESVLADCQYSSTFASNMIRCYGPARAPFIFDTWRSPEVLSAISRIAGIDLIPAIEFETGHVNVSINERPCGAANTGYGESSQDIDLQTFAWHFDSYAFVCVVMLSECSGMVGGETAIRTGNGEVVKVRGPTMGSAVVMQGRYIEHQALAARGGRERISMVTAFRPKSPFIRDETVLTGSRPISDKYALYGQYTEYRLEILEERLRDQSKRMRERQRYNRSLDTSGIRTFLETQRRFLDAMLLELTE